MRKILLLITLSVVFTTLNAQTKLNLQEYTGRYIFPAGSLAEDAVVSVVNDTTLNISASIGESNLEYLEKEMFTMPQYGGTIIFIRDDSDKIQGFKVTIPMAGIVSLEAQKEEKKESEGDALTEKNISQK
ncbi:hypothetical protein [Dysgonomonas sp.]